MELKTLSDVEIGISRSLDAELFFMDRTHAQTSSIRGRIAHSLEKTIFKDGEDAIEGKLDIIPILLKTLADQDRAQAGVVSAKLRKQEGASVLEAAKIISDSLAAEESVREIPDDITAPPPIPAEMEQLILAKIKPTELKTNPMDFTE